MARNASITIECFDGAYNFRLGWGEIILVQEETNAGPFFLLNRLHDSSWRVEDISSIIRCGLIGGGMKPEEALKKVNTYVKSRPPMENLQLAQAVLSAGLIGAPEEDSPGKRKVSKDSRIDDLPNGRVRFGELYKMGAKMGLDPETIDKMSIFQYSAHLQGWIEANIVDQGLADNEKDELWDLVKEVTPNGDRT